MVEYFKVAAKCRGRFQVTERFGGHIADFPALNAPDMIVRVQAPVIQFLPAAKVQLFYAPNLREDFKIPIHGSQTDIGQLTAHPLVDLVGAEMLAGGL